MAVSSRFVGRGDFLNIYRKRYKEVIRLIMRWAGCWMVVLSVWGFARVDAEEPRYPQWFMEGAKEGALAVGYSTTFFHADSSVAYALRDGAGNIVTGRAVRIQSEEGFARVGGGWRFMGRVFHEEVDSSEVEVVMRQARMVDAITVGRSCIALVAVGEDLPPVDTARVQMSSTGPKWVDALPREKNAVHAVGVARLYYYEHHSWQEAERAARMELARTVLAQIRQLSKQADGVLENVTVTETDVVLRGVRMVKRWLDREREVCYVLARMPVR